MAAQYTLQFGVPSKSLDALAGTTATNGTEYALPGQDGSSITWQSVFSSAPSAVNVVLQLSNDGITYYTVDTSTNTAGEIRTFNTSARFARARLVSKTDGGTTTIILNAQSYSLGIVADSIFDFTLDALIPDGTAGQVLTTDGAGGITFESLPASGVAWGDITGTLSAQTDLQSALDAKQNDITGADTQLLFFDGVNNPAGDAGLTYDKTTNQLRFTPGPLIGGFIDDGNDSQPTFLIAPASGSESGLLVASSFVDGDTWTGLSIRSLSGQVWVDSMIDGSRSTTTLRVRTGSGGLELSSTGGPVDIYTGTVLTLAGLNGAAENLTFDFSAADVVTVASTTGVDRVDFGTINVKATLQTAENSTTGLTAGVLAALTNASLVITDGSGQVYRVPCII